jgi:AcrR family transcriptional regulator
MSPGSLLERALDPAVETPGDGLSERILDAALALSAADGVRHLTMDDVAERAAVGRMTVYRRFGSRDSLVEALSVREARRCLAEMDASVDPEAPVSDQIAQGFLTTLRLVREHPLLDRLARLEPATALAALTANDGALFAMSRAFVAARLKEAKRQRLIGEVDPDEAAELLVRLGFSFLLIRDSALPLDDDEHAMEVARALIAPMLGGRGGPGA